MIETLSCSVTLEKQGTFLGNTIFSGAATKKKGTRSGATKKAEYWGTQKRPNQKQTADRRLLARARLDLVPFRLRYLASSSPQREQSTETLA